MAKAILVIDMPRSCAECTLRTSLEANYLYCIATLPRLKIDPMTVHIIKEHKCPLKPLPPSSKENGRYVREKCFTESLSENYLDYENGWNACIDEILSQRIESVENALEITDEEADCCGVQLWHDD